MEIIYPSIDARVQTIQTIEYDFDWINHEGVITMKLELIGENWDTVRYKSRIHLPQDTEFTTLDPNPNNQVIRNGKKHCGLKKITLKKGYYYIVGFWADLVG